jgi:hypothetical protein
MGPGSTSAPVIALMVASTLRSRVEPSVSPRRCFERTKPTLRRGMRDTICADYRSVPDRAHCPSIAGVTGRPSAWSLALQPPSIQLSQSSGRIPPGTIAVSIQRRIAALVSASRIWSSLTSSIRSAPCAIMFGACVSREAATRKSTHAAEESQTQNQESPELTGISRAARGRFTRSPRGGGGHPVDFDRARRRRSRSLARSTPPIAAEFPPARTPPPPPLARGRECAARRPLHSPLQNREHAARKIARCDVDGVVSDGCGRRWREPRRRDGARRPASQRHARDRAGLGVDEVRHLLR